jgi:hypothetical protein
MCDWNARVCWGVIQVGGSSFNIHLETQEGFANVDATSLLSMPKTTMVKSCPVPAREGIKKIKTELE